MKVIEAKALPEFRLFLRFDDGVSGVADLSALPVEAFFLHGFVPGFLIVSELRIWALSSGLKRSIFVLIRSTSKSQASRQKICFLPFTADRHVPEISRFYGIVIQIYLRKSSIHRGSGSARQVAGRKRVDIRRTRSLRHTFCDTMHLKK